MSYTHTHQNLTQDWSEEDIIKIALSDYDMVKADLAEVDETDHIHPYLVQEYCTARYRLEASGFFLLEWL